MRSVKFTRTIQSSPTHALPAVVLLAACDEEKPNNVLKEAIDVQGTCREDHVQHSDEYAGQIVRWQMADTGKIAAYGFVSKKGDLASHVIDEVTHPNVYHTPQQISFFDIDIDTSQPKWTLHGVSDLGASPEDAIQGYSRFLRQGGHGRTCCWLDPVASEVRLQFLTQPRPICDIWGSPCLAALAAWWRYQSVGDTY
jgi:hypothetical protein